MKERNEHNSWSPWPFLRLFGSGILLAVILILGCVAVKFCLGLFMTGDYIVSLPGKSPVISQSMLTVPIENDVILEDADPDSPVITQTAHASIAAVGDIMTHAPIVNSGKTGDGYNFDYFFTYIGNYASSMDYTVANLDATLAGTENGNAYSGYPNFNGPDAIASSAAQAGFNLLLTGNDHCNDYGTYGLKRTLGVLQSNGLDTLGTTNTTEDVPYIVKDVDGVKVGMVSYTAATIGSDGSVTINKNKLDAASASLVNAFDYGKLDDFYAQMDSTIASMKADGAEAIVLYIHWGNELSLTVTDYQKIIAQKMCDLGVDVIVGSHPHVVQPIELLTSATDSNHSAVCLYSTGNFLSNQRATNISMTSGHTEDGVFFSFTFAKYSDGSVYLDSVSLIPTWILIRGTGDGRQYQSLPLDTNLSDWRATFQLDADQLKNATASYERTAAIISDGQTQVNAFLSEAKSAREAAFAAAAGT